MVFLPEKNLGATDLKNLVRIHNLALGVTWAGFHLATPPPFLCKVKNVINGISVKILELREFDQEPYIFGINIF